jgi:hypothetical protein
MPVDWIEAALEEYRSLRDESLQAIDRQVRVLGLGTTASGIVLGLGIKAGLSSSTAFALLVGFAPLLALLVCVLWLGEMERMVRAGAQIALIEQRISRRIDPDDPPLSWETSLRSHQPSRRRILSVYRAIFGILGLIAATSSVLGNLGVADRSEPFLVAVTSLLDALILVTLTRTFIVTEYRLRAIGGKNWSQNDMPRLVRWLRFEQQLLEICEPTPVD